MYLLRTIQLPFGINQHQEINITTTATNSNLVLYSKVNPMQYPNEHDDNGSVEKNDMI